MKFSKSSPAERSALVRMVSASVRLIVLIGKAIRTSDADSYTRVGGLVDEQCEEFVDAIIGVQESE